MKRDYYEILGVSKNASNEEIKRAYRKLALQYHPDRCKDKKAAEENFKEISEAYEVLADEEKRRMYDTYGHMGVSERFSPGGFDWSDFTHFRDIEDMFDTDFFGRDIFEMFFGRGGFPRREVREEIRYDIDVTLEEVVSGAKKEIETRRTEECKRCNGSGAEPGTEVKTCSVCNGLGQIKNVQVRGFTRLITVDSCRRCNGNGKIITVQCKECNGRGKVRAKKKLLVTIPKGCEDNTLLRLRDEADSYIVIHVLPHKIFERNGSDLIMTVPISFSQAALGDDIEVQTINGSKAVVKIPPGTQTHTTFILRGRGLPVFGDRGFGNQIVKVVVVTPKKLTQRERELFKELSEIGGEERDRSFFSRFK